MLRIVVSICTAASSGPCMSRQVWMRYGYCLTGNRLCSWSRTALRSRARLELDLDGRDVPRVASADRSCRAGSAVPDRHEHERRVVFAHLALVEIDDGEVVADGLRRLPAVGNVIFTSSPGRQKKKSRTSPVSSLRYAGSDGDAQHDAGGLLLRRIERRGFGRLHVAYGIGRHGVGRTGRLEPRLAGGTAARRAAARRRTALLPASRARSPLAPRTPARTSPGLSVSPAGRRELGSSGVVAVLAQARSSTCWRFSGCCRYWPKSPTSA